MSINPMMPLLMSIERQNIVDSFAMALSKQVSRSELSNGILGL